MKTRKLSTQTLLLTFLLLPPLLAGMRRCENPRVQDRGFLITNTALNHPPMVEEVTYEPSRFTCGTPLTICAQVVDPDSDPLAFSWHSGEVEVRSLETQRIDTQTVRHCATFATAGLRTIDYEVLFKVRDQAYDQQGNLVALEELLQNGERSFDQAQLSIRVLREGACVDL